MSGKSMDMRKQGYFALHVSSLIHRFGDSNPDWDLFRNDKRLGTRLLGPVTHHRSWSVNLTRSLLT